MAQVRKTVGRTSSMPNRRTQAAIDRLEALGCDPIEGMGRIAMDEKVEMSIRAQMYKELAQYVASKRRQLKFKPILDSGISTC
jgi:hypothetical protein